MQPIRPVPPQRSPGRGILAPGRSPWANESGNEAAARTVAEQRAKELEEQQRKEATTEQEASPEPTDREDVAASHSSQSGTQACTVPSLRGDSADAARRALAKAHCRLGKVSKPKGHHHGHWSSHSNTLVLAGSCRATRIRGHSGWLASSSVAREYMSRGRIAAVSFVLVALMAGGVTVAVGPSPLGRHPRFLHWRASRTSLQRTSRRVRSRGQPPRLRSPWLQGCLRRVNPNTVMPRPAPSLDRLKSAMAGQS